MTGVAAAAMSLVLATGCGTSRAPSVSARTATRSVPSTTGPGAQAALGFAATHHVDHAFVPIAPPSHCAPGVLCPGPIPPLVQIAHTRLLLAARDPIVVSASVDLYLQAAGGTSAVDLLIRVDGRVAGQCDGFAAGANGNTISCDGFVDNVGSGQHEIALLARSLGGRRVGVGFLSLSAIAVPRHN